MKLFELVFGDMRKYIAAKDEKEAYEIGTDAEKCPEWFFRPFEVVPIELEGYEINVKPIKKKDEKSEK